MATPRPSVVAHLEAVRKTYGVESPRIALDGIDLSVVEGEFIAAIGPAGCGTSTLLKVLGGLETTIEGRAYLGETEITRMDESDIAPLRRRNVGFVWPLDLVPTLDVLSNIRLPFTRSGQPMRPSEDDRVRDLIASFGLQEHRFRFPHELSGCHERRVAIARALAPVPRLVLADDPTGDLDARSGEEVVALLRASAREYGHAIVMSTHDPSAASQADRVVFLAHGVIVDERCGLGPEDIRREVRFLEGAA
ncbi:peptide ABC transporter ATP-binding protein [Clavibacter michiganensis]|uniref:ABC transporter ATP-binding protein n=1 Tax=Clavibacter michiganensis TaxID=28447 RepID=UPI000CE7A94F|nr:ABC transporter ATP-binding protein [Clavibacter michiganensis]PPF91298.1 peptide ABC transporter ATP-binding protein [Clavibacter michiganensis]PPF99340.1 peptide ABC transporter ATP-binding protein [Clavibacter michiganensis]